MKVYYEKKTKKVKVISFFAKLFIFASIVGGIVFVAQQFEYLKYALRFKIDIRNAAVVLFGLGVVLLIIAKILNKRKNVKFDGNVIKFCVNNYIEHEFDLKKIDEMFNYRDSENITYGLQNAIAFRFHKNETWETIDSSLYNSKTKKSSIELIRDINVAYASIKTQRALKEMSNTKGIRFRYLTIELGKEANIDERNAALKDFEKLFKGYSNTYGSFQLDRLVLTNDSFLHNKERIASKNNGDYIRVVPVYSGINTDFLKSDFIEFYNAQDELKTTIDLTQVVNGELFKSICLAVFDLK